MCRHGPVIVHCTDSEDFPWKLVTTGINSVQSVCL